MTRFSLSDPLVADPGQQRNNDDLLAAANTLADLWTSGTGVPTFTPAGRAAYLRQDGGIGSSFYIYNGTSWTAVA